MFCEFRSLWGIVDNTTILTALLVVLVTIQLSSLVLIGVIYKLLLIKVENERS